MASGSYWSTGAHTCVLKGTGGTVGSKENMWSQSTACINRARLSTSFAIGPEDGCTNVVRNIRKSSLIFQTAHVALCVANNDTCLNYLIFALDKWGVDPVNWPKHKEIRTSKQNKSYSRDVVQKWYDCTIIHTTEQSRDTHLSRPAVGLKPQMPQNEAGIRILPPISPPIPSTEPPPAMRAPSPLDDPPDVFWTLWGFKVVP